MKIEPLSQFDLKRIGFLQPEGWSDIVTEFEYYIRKDFCFPVKVTCNNRITGVGAAICLGTTGWLAHIIVDPVYRKRGIGSLIVEELLSILRNNGAATFLLIATEIGRPVYLNAGFRIATEYLFLRRENRWPGFPPSVNIIPFVEPYRNSLLTLDTFVTGETRERLFGDRIEQAFLYVDGSELLGYYIPGVGEGPLVATSPDAGLELMKLKYSSADKAVLPSDNLTALEFLVSAGFALSPTKGTRMILGEDITWKPDKIYSRIAGNFG